MKQLTCEMCGSTDVVKQDGLFVCQSCGTKYSVEEAKKMMIEGTVAVEGTVQIDHSKELENLYTLARRAVRENSDPNAIKYYEQIVVKDPYSWEAVFYTAYFKARSSAMSGDYSGAEQYLNSENTVFWLIHDKVTGLEAQRGCVDEVVNRSISLAALFFNAANDRVRKYRDMRYLTGMAVSRNILFHCGDIIDNNFDPSIASVSAVKAWMYGLKLNDAIPSKQTINEKKFYSEKIKKYIPSYSSGGCYVATAVYGSYDCPEVWLLRRYRDYYLKNRLWGRLFISCYYSISPVLLRLVGDKSLFIAFTKSILDKKVKKLRDHGYSDKPYSD